MKVRISSTILIILFLSLFIFMIVPMLQSIGENNPNISSYVWCEVPKGIVHFEGLCHSQISLLNILFAIVAFLSIILTGYIMILKESKNNDNTTIFLLWLIILISLPLIRNSLSNILFSIQAIIVSFSMILLQVSNKRSISLTLLIISSIISAIFFGWLFTIMLLPILLILVLKEDLWKDEKTWYRILVFAVPVLFSFLIASYLMLMNISSSIRNDLVGNIMLSSVTHGYPLSFISAVLFSLAVLFIRLHEEFRLVWLGIIGLFYYSILGPVSLALHLVLLSIIFLYGIKWIITTKWSFAITKYILLISLIGSIIIFSLIAYFQAPMEEGLSVADIEGKVFSLGVHTAVYSCYYETYPSVSYDRRNKLGIVMEVIEDNDLKVLHDLLSKNNVNYIVLDRSYVINLLGKDDTGILFVLRISDDFLRIYPDNGNPNLEYYYVYP